MATSRFGKSEKRQLTDLGNTSGSDANSGTDLPREKGEYAVHEQGFGDPENGHVEVDSIIEGPADKGDILTHTIHLEDDPTLSALTFRTFFLGTGFSFFGGALATIYYFKPQTVLITTSFLAVVIYMAGEFMAFIIPRRGIIGRFLNPHPFNIKEHLAIVIMANSASISAAGIEVLAAEQLYYNVNLSGATSIFLLFSSQFLGYGLAGLLRRALVYPMNMLWPVNLPVNAMLETFHRNKAETRKPLKVFCIVFACIFVWEIFPEWIMPILTGVSIFCLANRNSATFTNIFGGSQGDEGLGLFSICFDWQYISGGLSPLWYPMESLISQGLGISLCIIVFAGAYYGNVWDAQKFPFLSQSIFSSNSSAADFQTWNQTFVINADNTINSTALEIEGLPFLSTSYAINILVTSMATTASICHLALWHWKDVRSAFQIYAWSNLKRIFKPSSWKFWQNDSVPDEDQPHYDPHYKLMLAYKACPDWWYAVVLALSFAIGMVVIYKAESTLPWWGFIVAILNGYAFLILFGSMQAITGVPWLVQPIVQMIGGYIQPGNPVANMFYSLYGYNALIQGELLSQDLKLAQYGHLAPRVTFSMQMLGTFFGAIITYIMTNEIITNQRATLISLEGSNVWSGQQVQSFNSLAVMWGGMPHQLFSVGGTYQWITLIFFLGFLIPIPLWLAHRRWPNVGFNNINGAVVVLYISWLCVGINSSLMSFFIIGFASQWFTRKRYPNLFVKYNYLVSAALDGGTSVIVFILSFAVFGAAGVAYNFPSYWGNNFNNPNANYDYCEYIQGA